MKNGKRMEFAVTIENYEDDTGKNVNASVLFKFVLDLEYPEGQSETSNVEGTKAILSDTTKTFLENIRDFILNSEEIKHELLSRNLPQTFEGLFTMEGKPNAAKIFKRGAYWYRVAPTELKELLRTNMFKASEAELEAAHFTEPTLEGNQVDPSQAMPSSNSKFDELSKLEVILNKDFNVVEDRPDYWMLEAGLV